MILCYCYYNTMMTMRQQRNNGDYRPSMAMIAYYIPTVSVFFLFLVVKLVD